MGGGARAGSGGGGGAAALGGGDPLAGGGASGGGGLILGTIAPGHSIGTHNATGTYTHAPGSTPTVEDNGAGQSDRLAVTGAATINGGTVAVQAAAGSYPRNPS